MPNPSVGPKQGGVAPPTQQQCEGLKTRNTRTRSTVKRRLQRKPRKTKADKTALRKISGTGMAISSVTSTVPGAGGTFTASSSGVANRLIPSGQVDGGTERQRAGINKKTRQSKAKRHEAKKRAAGVLCDNSHVHPGGGKGAHAECKIVNTLTNKAASASKMMRGGSMLFNVDWRSSTFSQGDQSGMPCETCFAMMCHAVTECDITVHICDHENKPQPLSKDDCASDTAYRDLCQRIDGNPTPGRG